MSETVSKTPKASDQQNQQASPILQEAIVWRERQRFMLITGLTIAFLLLLATVLTLAVLNRWIEAQRQIIVTVMPLQAQKHSTSHQMETEPLSKTLPLSVQKYLTELEEIERRRQSLLGNYQLPTKGLDDYWARVKRLQEQVQQLTPPPECNALHQDYEQVLKTHLTVIEQVKREAHWGSVFDLSSGARLQIDTALRAADNTLEILCRRYGVPKPFSIRQLKNNPSEDNDP